MSPNCEPCNRGEHHLCDEGWCECRKSHGKPDVTQLQYRLVLDDLNRLTATFMYLTDTSPVVLSIPRDVWDTMGHPTSLAVDAKP